MCSPCALMLSNSGWELHVSMPIPLMSSTLKIQLTISQLQCHITCLPARKEATWCLFQGHVDFSYVWSKSIPIKSVITWIWHTVSNCVMGWKQQKVFFYIYTKSKCSPHTQLHKNMALQKLNNFIVCNFMHCQRY